MVFTLFYHHVLGSLVTAHPSATAGIGFDNGGNIVYINNNIVTKLQLPSLTKTDVSTLTSGPCMGSNFFHTVTDTSTNTMYAACLTGIVKIDMTTFVTTAFAGGGLPYTDGQGIVAGFTHILGIARQPTTGNLFVRDSSAIRRISTTGLVNTVAGSSTEEQLSRLLTLLSSAAPWGSSFYPVSGPLL